MVLEGTENGNSSKSSRQTPLLRGVNDSFSEWWKLSSLKDICFSYAWHKYKQLNDFI